MKKIMIIAALIFLSAFASKTFAALIINNSTPFQYMITLDDGSSYAVPASTSSNYPTNSLTGALIDSATSDCAQVFVTPGTVSVCLTAPVLATLYGGFAPITIVYMELGGDIIVNIL